MQCACARENRRKLTITRKANQNNNGGFYLEHKDASESKTVTYSQDHIARLLMRVGEIFAQNSGYYVELLHGDVLYHITEAVTNLVKKFQDCRFRVIEQLEFRPFSFFDINGPLYNSWCRSISYSQGYIIVLSYRDVKLVYILSKSQ
jgi:hypothetical protein